MFDRDNIVPTIYIPLEIMHDLKRWALTETDILHIKELLILPDDDRPAPYSAVFPVIDNHHIYAVYFNYNSGEVLIYGQNHRVSTNVVKRGEDVWEALHIKTLWKQLALIIEKDSSRSLEVWTIDWPQVSAPFPDCHAELISMPTEWNRLWTSSLLCSRISSSQTCTLF